MNKRSEEQIEDAYPMILGVAMGYENVLVLCRGVNPLSMVGGGTQVVCLN